MAVSIARKGMLLIISGPSGAGKGTLVKKLLSSDPSFRLSCSVTTRQPREGEIEGVHYYFIDDAKYAQLVEENAFLEHASVHGHSYGTLREPVEKMISEGSERGAGDRSSGCAFRYEKRAAIMSAFSFFPPALRICACVCIPAIPTTRWRSSAG